LQLIESLVDDHFERQRKATEMIKSGIIRPIKITHPWELAKLGVVIEEDEEEIKESKK
jgi:hypothetical protein